jgi:hypothetical protein
MVSSVLDKFCLITQDTLDSLKHMKEGFAGIVLVSALLLTLITGRAFAQNRLPGVSVGNEFTYTQFSEWTSTDPNAPMPAGLADVNSTDYYRVIVTGVTGSNVSTNVQWHFTNGTTVEYSGSVSTETTDYKGGYWVIISSNLNENDRVHPNDAQDLSTINDTIAWNYQSYQRQTNFLSREFSYEQTDIPNSIYTEHVNTYFDRQTGALVQLEDTHTYHDPDITLMVVWKLTSQNAWTGSDINQLPLLFEILVAITVVALVLLLAALISRKRRRSQKT